MAGKIQYATQLSQTCPRQITKTTVMPNLGSFWDVTEMEKTFHLGMLPHSKKKTAVILRCMGTPKAVNHS